MVLDVRNDSAQNSSYVLEEVEFSRALFELYEGGVVRAKTILMHSL